MPRQIHRDPRHRAHFRLIPFERLQPPDGHPPPGMFEFVAHPDGARGERPGDDRARAADGERAVDPQPHVGIAVRWRQPIDERQQFRAHPVQVGAENHGQIGQRGARKLLLHLIDGARRIGEVGLADHDQRVPHAQRVQSGEVLVGLRHPALGGRDHEHDRWHRAHAGQHVRDEPLVARHVDERELPPVDLGPRETQVDRQPPALLLGQPIGPHAGEPLHERGLAVVDVPGGGYDEHARTALSTSSSSSGATVRKSNRQRPASRRPTTDGVPVRSGAA